jgi:hypothetical protein
MMKREKNRKSFNSKSQYYTLMLKNRFMSGEEAGEEAAL